MAPLASAPRHSPELARRYMDAGWWTDEVAHDWVAGWAAATPDAPAAIGPDGTLTYAALDDRARRFASGLLGLGLGRGDVIGVQLPNTPDFLAVFLGIQIVGAVPCMLPMPYRAAELEPLLAHGGARAVICFAGMEGYDVGPVMAGLCDALPALEIVIALGDTLAGGIRFEDLVASEIVEIADPPDADDPAVLAFTSGTSAAPKAILHTHRTLSAACAGGRATFVLSSADVVMCAPAYTHAFGLIIVVTTLAAGAASATMAAYSPAALAETIQRTRATVFCGGPVHVFMGEKAGLWGPEVTRTLARSYIGGAPTPVEAVRIIDDACTNGRAYQLWGMSEVLLPVMPPLDSPRSKRLSRVGVAWNGHEARVVGDDGALLPPGEEGHLETRGPYQFAGYFGNEEANAKSFRPDGWFRTGDLASLDGDGHVAISGRARDVIIRGGVKINPVDVELAMDAHPAVAQSAIVPVPDAVLGERACLVVVLSPGAALTLEDMRAYLASKGIAKLRWPERVEVVAAMPMTASRKIIKGKLIEQIGVG